MTLLTADAAAALGGPDWLRARRMGAWERFSATALPTDAEEVWRYSRIAELDLDAYAPVDPGAPAPAYDSEQLRPLLDAVGARAGLLVLVDGRLVHAELDDALRARGVVLGDVTDLDDAEERLGAVASSTVDAFTELNAAFTASTAVVRVPPGVIVAAPFVVAHVVRAAGAAVFPRTLVVAGRDSEVTVLEHVSSPPDVDALVVPVAELDVDDAARVRHLVVQDLGPRVWEVGYQCSQVGRDASVAAHVVALGGDYARVRTDSRLVGQGASAELLAVYFGEGGQMHDFRTLQEHVAPRTTSDLLFKGAVEDRARSVYSGLIRIRKDAARSNAFQTNRNLVLSEGASAESVPNLEIENNDVRCSHASAVGPIDEEQRYYLESRGIPPEVAERLIVLGFFGEVLARVPVPAFAEPLREAVAAKLDRRES